jgi:5-formyltetrahydrofolate cyclo-ligase
MADDPEVIAAKRLARQQAKARRAAAAQAAPAGAAVRAVDILFDAFLHPGEAVAVYWSIDDEFETALLRRRLLAAGHAVALPVVQGPGRALALRRWRPGEPLQAGPFAIREPMASAPILRPDLVVAPLLAVDRRGYRLGYGAGYYDRTLATLRAAGPVRVVGWCWQAQVVERVPAGPHDQRLDAVVTEAGSFICA